MTLHRYLYAGNNPVMNVDPSGKFFSLSSLMTSTAIRGLLVNFTFSAVVGGADAALRGDPVIAGALESGLVGSFLGPIGVIKFVRPVLVVSGFGLGVIGVTDAISEGNAELAIFRSALVLNGARSFSKAMQYKGRLGKRNVRAQNRAIADDLKARGWKITGGGGYLKEEYLPGPGGGRKGSNWVDITAQKNGKTIRIQTVDTKSDGVTPTLREAANAAMIRQKTGDHVILVPKNNWAF